jgi:hypothetical protein
LGSTQEVVVGLTKENSLCGLKETQERETKMRHRHQCLVY